MRLSHSHLYQECQPVTFENSLRNLHLAQKLIQLMLKEKGIGLAANQAGLDLRLFVMYVDGEFFHCFNPEIIEYSEETQEMLEGCLSFPGERCPVTRPVKILAQFYNARGNPDRREFTGIAARCFQHELDHLNGITMQNKSYHDRQTLQLGS
jgi:peptide deformylase